MFWGQVSLIQHALYEQVVAEYGANKVGSEAITASGRPAGLIVDGQNGYIVDPCTAACRI